MDRRRRLQHICRDLKLLHDELCEIIDNDSDESSDEEEEDDTMAATEPVKKKETCVCAKCGLAKPTNSFQLEKVKKKLKHGEKAYRWRRKTCKECCNKGRRGKRKRGDDTVAAVAVDEKNHAEEEFLQKRPWIALHPSPPPRRRVDK
jgi:hypothetical protein